MLLFSLRNHHFLREFEKKTLPSASSYDFSPPDSLFFFLFQSRKMIFAAISLTSLATFLFGSNCLTCDRKKNVPT